MDEAYANAAFIPDAAAFPPRWAQAAARFRANSRAELGIGYGPGERQCFDLFLPEGPPRGVMIFIHGGYWRAFDRGDWSHLAAGGVARGWAVALPGYTLAPDARIAEITRQIRAAVQAIAERVPGPVVLTGHSAGGHLAARMVCADVALPVAARVRRVVPISPLCDLRPLLQTAINDDLRLDVAEAQSESPIFQPAPDTEVVVWVGGDERPAFLDQARWLAEKWQCPLRIAEGQHHFNVIDGLEDPESPLTRTLLDGI